VSTLAEEFRHDQHRELLSDDAADLRAADVRVKGCPKPA
jgi:hypothetical protein